MFKKNIEVKKLDHENIIQVGTKSETTKLVEDFYTKNPFPNYDDLETRYIQTDTLDLTVPIHKKKKRKKNTVLNQTELCMARKADTGQCTRRRKDGSDFCGKHNGQLKFGRIDDAVLSKDKQNFIQCSF